MKRVFSTILASVAIMAVFFGFLSACVRAEAFVNTSPFSAMGGSWSMRSGAGTVRISGNTGNLSLQSGTVRISSLSANADDTGGSAVVKLQSQWLLSSGGSSSNYPLSFENTGTFTNTGVNTYGASYGGGTISGSVVVTLTSATSASVTQIETNSSSTDGYTVTLSYTLAKVSDDASDSSGCDTGAFGPMALAVLGLYAVKRRR